MALVEQCRVRGCPGLFYQSRMVLNMADRDTNETHEIWQL